MEYSNRTMWDEAKYRIGPITTFKFGIILYTIQIWLLINGTFLAPNGFSQNAAFIYLSLPLGYLAYAYKNQKIVDKMAIGRMVSTGMVGFIITPAIVVGVYYYIFGWAFPSIESTAVLGTIITMVFFVAPVEELIFRGMLPNYMESVLPKKMVLGGLLLTQFGFAVFHYAAYQGDVFGILIAFIVGCIWLAASRWKVLDKGKTRLGIGFTMGSHCAYNLVVCGLLVGNITTVMGA